MPPEHLFKTYADKWLENSPSSVVPIIGSGVNIQASKLQGTDKILNWDTLLKEIISSSGIAIDKFPEFPSSFIRKWESIIRIIAVNTRGYHPYLTERDLQKKVQQILHIYEEECMDYDLYKLISKNSFHDIISLNFDRCLALSANSKSIISHSKENSKDGTTLYRHSLIKQKSSTSRIWYPHGDTKRLDTIKLGVRKYGVYLDWIENLRGSYMNRWDKENAKYLKTHDRSWIPPEKWDEVVRTWKTPASWVNVFKSAPLLFIGCSLLSDEWPLWYLLNQRARQTAYLNKSDSPDSAPETIILSAGSSRPPHLINQPENLINIHFDSFDSMWKCVIDFLEESQRV